MALCICDCFVRNCVYFGLFKLLLASLRTNINTSAKGALPYLLFRFDFKV